MAPVPVRRRSGSRPQRAARKPSVPRSPRNRQAFPPASTVFVLAAAVLILFAAGRAFTLRTGAGPPPPAVPFQYVILSGDTPRSIAGLFEADPAGIESQTGAGYEDEPLTPGLEVTVDAAQLWSGMTGPATADNEALVASTARRLQVEPALALAVAWEESRLRQDALSATGATGIMQVEPDTGALASRDLGASLNPSDAADNVLAGIFWLRSLLNRYGGDRASALAAYYEGPGNLDRRGYLQGTAEYVSRAQQIRNALLLVRPDLSR